MCGIHVSISRQDFRAPSETLKSLLKNRGPDHLGQIHAKEELETGGTSYILLTSTVLALRGGHVTPQPFIDQMTGSALCWNGEAWKIGAEIVKGNDGQAIFDQLARASSPQVEIMESTSAILNVLRSISGPCAFVFLDKVHGQVYFGRDRLGRRSLLYKLDVDSSSLELSSVTDSLDERWHEVEAAGIYRLSYRDSRFVSCPQETLLESIPNSSISIARHEWEDVDSITPGISLGVFNRSIPEPDFCLDHGAKSVTALGGQLNESLRLRLLNIPRPTGNKDDSVRIAVLFSGGLDCSVLARMAHDIIPADQQIDLLNVAFENPRVIRAAKNQTKASKQKVEKHELTEENLDQEPVVPEEFTETSAYENCPDRITGRKAFQELQDICPNRVWRFIAVNVPYTETISHRPQVINLIRPHNTEMDLSIACALYFASRGTGLATTCHDSTPTLYTTPARVLLSGLGADELFGGYTRHFKAFSRNGFTGLLDELKLDVDRLGKRNLGRDDRVISSWGKEVRFPYLDEKLVKWAVECPIWEKCGFGIATSEKKDGLPEIEPGKKVLRLLACELGMHSVATEKKRAIQFGARTAKMELGNTKGTTMIS